MYNAVRRVYRVVVLVGSGPQDAVRCCREILDTGLSDSLVVVTDSDVAKCFVIPGEQQVLYIAPKIGDWRTVFEFSRQMKELNRELRVGWVYDEPYLREPIDRIVSRKPGDSFQALADDIGPCLGYSLFQTYQTV